MGVETSGGNVIVDGGTRVKRQLTYVRVLERTERGTQPIRLRRNHRRGRGKLTPEAEGGQHKGEGLLIGPNVTEKREGYPLIGKLETHTLPQAVRESKVIAIRGVKV